MEKGIQDGQAPVGPPGGPPGPPGGWLFTRMSRKQEILFNIMVAMLQLIPQSTLTTVMPVSKDIGQSFSVSNVSVLPWVVAAYALSFGTFILIGGRLGDIFGHKTMVVIGYGWLSFWSIVAGLSHYAGYEVFFVARGFQGIGASLLVPNGLALLGRTYPPGSKQKIFAFTLFGMCAPIGAYPGMIFGALFTRYAGWWWSFYTLAMVCCFLAIAATFILVSPPPTPKQMLPVRERLREMDWLGAVTGVGGLVCVQVSLVSAPASGWSTQYIFMLLILGILLIAFFIVTELKIAEQPLVPFRMLKADVGFVLGAVACGWATFGIWTWFLWKFLLTIKLDAPLEAALQVFPIVPVAFIASVLTAWMMKKCQPCWTLFWALVAFAFGPLLLAIDSGINTTTYWSWTFASLVVMPFGMDMSFPAATLIMSNYFPPQQQGVAGSLISTTVYYSISLGIGLASTVEVHVNDHGRKRLAGVRGAWYMGVGLAGLGVLICVAFIVRSILHPAPSISTGPPGPPAHITPGSKEQMTPPEPSPERKPSRPATQTSLATTVVPDSPEPQSPKLSDPGPFRSFNFEMDFMPPSSTPTLIPPRRQSLQNNHATTPRSPQAPQTRKSRKSDATYHSKQIRKVDADISHSPSESLLHLQASSPRMPISSPPTMSLPTELDPVYRSRGSFESEEEVVGRPAQRHGYGHNYGLSSELRDVDGFGYEVKPVAPRGIMGDKF
ncbi:multidrug-resistance type transporter aminotriazole resistance [Cladophialophora chaetospira]|uniref:Multidrug-resistance type transporter aminotriazole resistance n=1 Tax=Cladophialophora chaetospira TaxID=386627 RepID=A0AA39CGF6_9EURO|nr:multidrug-resistance type transporter aminotriazole resistance [Cladophialophora chaetospira]